MTSKDNKSDEIVVKAHKAAKQSKNDTHNQPEAIYRQAIYRIACIGFVYTKGGKRLDIALERAFKRIYQGHSGRQIALLPGVTEQGWPRKARHVRKLAKRYGVSVLFERGSAKWRAHYRAYDSAGTRLPVAIYQRFGKGKHAQMDKTMVADLVAECRLGGERVINLDGLPVGLLVCGETGMFEHPRSSSQPQLQHGLTQPLFDNVPLIFNGAHNTMRRWRELRPKLKYISSGKRWVFYATNCNRKTWGSSTLHIYHDGNQIADSKLKAPMNHAGATIYRVADPKKRDLFTALVADIPGHALI